MGKILVVTNHSYMLYRFRKELLQRLANDHQVVIVTPFVGHEKDLEKIGKCIKVDVDRRGMNPKTDLRLLHRYKDLLKQESPDFVITYSIKPNIYMGMLCKQMRIPYAANVQGLGTAFQSKKLAAVVTILYRHALKKAKIVFFENKNDAQDFLNYKIITTHQCMVLPGAGINLQEYSYQPYPTGKVRHFLYLGRIMREKGMDEWFEAAERMKKDYNDLVEFDMVGFFEDEYREKVEQLEEKGVIHFHGFQSEPRPYYTMASCVVMPSWHEGLSNVLLEAAASGRLIITSNVPGCRETVLDGETGYLCEVGNAEMLYQTMKKVMQLPTEDMERMGKRGRQWITENFAKEKVVEQTVNAINW